MSASVWRNSSLSETSAPLDLYFSVMIPGWDRVNCCRTNEQNKWMDSGLLVEAECHCLHKREHMLTIWTYRHGVSVMCSVGSTVDIPYSWFHLLSLCQALCRVRSLCTLSLVLLPRTVSGRFTGMCHSHFPSALNSITSHYSSHSPWLRNSVWVLCVSILRASVLEDPFYSECRLSTGGGE